MSSRMARSVLSLAPILLVAADVCGQPRSYGDRTNLGFNDQAITAIAASPSSPRTIYVATLPDGVYRSVDGGVSWSALTPGLSATGAGLRVLSTLAVDPASSKTAYIGWVVFFLPPFAQFLETALLKTLDGGSSWLFLLPDNGNALAIDPSSPATLYLASSTGVRRSDDRGTSWSRPFGPSSVASLALDPSNSSTVFAASSDSGVFKSVDGGNSWTAINSGLEQNEGGEISATSIAINPNDPRILRRSGTSNDPNDEVVVQDSGFGSDVEACGRPAGRRCSAGESREDFADRRLLSRKDAGRKSAPSQRR